MPHLPTSWIEVSRAALSSNLLEIRKLLSPHVKILAVVKADAYGHGAPAAARVFQQAGAEFLGVASSEEGGELREAGIRGRILIMGCCLPDEASDIVERDLIPTVCDVEFARSLSAAARKAGTDARVHVKIDTGMGRIGVRPEDACQFVHELMALGSLSVEGICTHFPSADENDPAFTLGQVRLLEEAVRSLAGLGCRIPIVHAANSAAVSALPQAQFDMVRVGLALYGIRPAPHTFAQSDLRPALSFKTRVVFVKNVPAGTSVSYGRTYVTEEPATLATLPCGYRHGLSWQLSNKGHVMIHGKKAPIAGRVCMDQTIVNVGHIPGVLAGDEVTVYSPDRGSGLTVEDVAEMLKTIPYEVLCHLDKKIPRLYV